MHKNRTGKDFLSVVHIILVVHFVDCRALMWYCGVLKGLEIGCATGPVKAKVFSLSLLGKVRSYSLAHLAFGRWYAAAPNPADDEEEQRPIGSPRLNQLVDEICKLNLLEVSDLIEVLRKRLNITAPMGGGYPMGERPAFRWGSLQKNTAYCIVLRSS